MEKGNTVGEQEKKEIAFSNRDLRRLIVPLLIEQMLNCTVGLLDSLMVSTVGEAAVSAVSLVDCVCRCSRRWLRAGRLWRGSTSAAGKRKKPAKPASSCCFP